MIRVRDSFAPSPRTTTPTLSDGGLLLRGLIARKEQRELRSLPLSAVIRRITADAINAVINFFHP